MMKQTKVKILPAVIDVIRLARLRDLQSRIENPQDLNDALLAVAVEEHARRATAIINGQIQSFMEKCLGVPWK